MEEKGQLNRSLGVLLQEAVTLRGLPLDERKERVVELAKTIDQKTTDLYQIILEITYQVFRQAVLASPERPSAYTEFLEWCQTIIDMIPEDDRPEPIQNADYERVGEFISGDSSQEPAF